MTAALILTQHDGACQLIAASDATDLKRRWLPGLAAGDRLATVGISQLTTSQRGNGPAMRAAVDGDGFQLDGFMPWVTSAGRCDLIVTGGVFAETDAAGRVPEGHQILAALPIDREGVEIPDQPMQLAALGASWTSAVTCRRVWIDAADVIRGPAERVLSIRAPVKSLTVSATGIGLAEALLELIDESRARRRAGFVEVCDRLAARLDALRAQLHDAADRRGDDPAAEFPAEQLRASINDLLQRLAITCITMSKGTGLLLDYAAQRLAREAMFFLVWSAPESVQTATLAGFGPLGDSSAAPADSA
jgi:alkylation response protein AidB-like acyl-CoA dehydrogenase